MNNKKVYVVFRTWTGFEDEDNNTTEICKIFNNYFDAKLYATGLVLDEIEFNMEFKADNEYDIRNISKEFDSFRYVQMYQETGDGCTSINIQEQELICR